MSKKTMDWKDRREKELLKIMHEIGRRLRRPGKQTIDSACQMIAKRLEKKPINLGQGKTLQLAWQTLRAHYWDWRNGRDRLKLRYVPGTSRISDEFTLYALPILMASESNAEAFEEIRNQWAEGFMVPGIGSRSDHYNRISEKAFPICLDSWLQHHLSACEREAVYSKMRANKAARKFLEAKKEEMNYES